MQGGTRVAGGAPQRGRAEAQAGEGGRGMGAEGGARGVARGGSAGASTAPPAAALVAAIAAALAALFAGYAFGGVENWPVSPREASGAAVLAYLSQAATALGAAGVDAAELLEAHARGAARAAASTEGAIIALAAAAGALLAHAHAHIVAPRWAAKRDEEVSDPADERVRAEAEEAVAAAREEVRRAEDAASALDASLAHHHRKSAERIAALEASLAEARATACAREPRAARAAEAEARMMEAEERAVDVTARAARDRDTNASELRALAASYSKQTEKLKDELAHLKLEHRAEVEKLANELAWRDGRGSDTPTMRSTAALDAAAQVADALSERNEARAEAAAAARERDEAKERAAEALERVLFLEQELEGERGERERVRAAAASASEAAAAASAQRDAAAARAVEAAELIARARADAERCREEAAIVAAKASAREREGEQERERSVYTIGDTRAPASADRPRSASRRLLPELEQQNQPYAAAVGSAELQAAQQQQSPRRQQTARMRHSTLAAVLGSVAPSPLPSADSAPPEAVYTPASDDAQSVFLRASRSESVKAPGFGAGRAGGTAALPQPLLPVSFSMDVVGEGGGNVRDSSSPAATSEKAPTASPSDSFVFTVPSGALEAASIARAPAAVQVASPARMSAAAQRPTSPAAQRYAAAAAARRDAAGRSIPPPGLRGPMSPASTAHALKVYAEETAALHARHVGAGQY